MGYPLWAQFVAEACAMAVAITLGEGIIANEVHTETLRGCMPRINGVIATARIGVSGRKNNIIEGPHRGWLLKSNRF